FGGIEGAVRDVYWSEEISGTTSKHGTELTREQMTGPEAAEHMDGLDFEGVWTTTDDLPVQQWRIQDLSLDLDDQQLMVGESTDVTVTLELAASADTTATTTAEYDLNTTAATIHNGTFESTDRGTAEVTASLAGHSDTGTVEMLAPPNLGVADTSLGETLVANGSSTTVEATLENAGDLEGTSTFSLDADDETVDSTTLTIDGRDERTVAFNWTAPGTGSYTLTLDGETVGTVEAVEPPEVSVTDASVGTETLLVGQEATVSTTLENPDRLAGSETATLVANDSVLQTQDISVGAESTNSTELSWTPSEAGTHDLMVNDIEAGSVEVVPRSAISVGDVTATEQVLTDETAEVTAEVVNDADVSVETTVAYTLDGEQVDTRSVTLEPGTNTVSFETELSTAGTAAHSISVVDAEGEAETAVREPATFEIIDVVAPETVDAGQDVTISVTAANTGGVAGNETVDVSVDGATVTDESVSIDAGESTRVSATFTLQAQGEHTFAVETTDDSTSGTITAESDTDEGTTDESTTDREAAGSGQTDRTTDDPEQSNREATTQQDDDTESGDGFGPGFGLVAALIVIVTLGVAAASIQ
ncbi:MAG: CARDB domain-containing protein, partial [Halapricum sp.]